MNCMTLDYSGSLHSDLNNFSSSVIMDAATPYSARLEVDEKRNFIEKLWPDSPRKETQNLDEFQEQYQQFFVFVDKEVVILEQDRTMFLISDLLVTLRLIQVLRDDPSACRNQLAIEIMDIWGRKVTQKKGKQPSLPLDDAGVFDISVNTKTRRSRERQDLDEEERQAGISCSGSSHSAQTTVNWDLFKAKTSMELVSRIWLTCNIHSLSTTTGVVTGGSGRIEWHDNKSLLETCTSAFPTSELADDDKRKAVVLFNLKAGHLTEWYGVSIRWTDNLADHLDFDHKEKSLAVYQHMICLKNHLESTTGSLIPLKVLEETVDTLRALFPFGDPKTTEFLLSEERPFHKLGSFEAKTQRRELQDYTYWGSKLSVLIHIVEKPPSRWWPWLHYYLFDRANIHDLASHWKGISAFLLSIFGVVFGTVSMVFGVRSYQQSQESYRLSRCQACAAPNAAETLSGFCPYENCGTK